jgi:cytochrome c peroxidase
MMATTGAVAVVMAVMATVASDTADLRTIYSGASSGWPQAWLAPDANFSELAALRLRPGPEPGSTDAAAVKLGQKLFFDPALSASGKVPCASCHDPSRGWGDGRAVARGHGGAEGRRNAPSLYSAGYRQAFFWDGRANTLEEQALGPLFNPIEMANAKADDIIGRIAADPDYPALFAAAFGDETVTIAQLTRAIAAFERGLDEPTRLDRFLSGDSQALNDAEISGLHLFRTKAGCVNCHSGPLLSDEGFHNLGLGLYGRRYHDMGRHDVTGDPEDAARFRTPSLRHIRKTAPYMHNGLVPDLDKVLLFYKSGGGRSIARNAAEAADPVFQGAASTSPFLNRLELTDKDWADLRAFLDAL